MHARHPHLKPACGQVQRGSFVMIAGPVGSGKSTLLASLACSRPPLRGICRVSGQRAFVPQKPFLLNGTVKENILFGLQLDEERYATSLQLAALLEDLSTLSQGDQTPVGESGVPLPVNHLLTCLHLHCCIAAYTMRDYYVRIIITYSKGLLAPFGRF